MADTNASHSDALQGSKRNGQDAKGGRPRVQQLRPTNKGAPLTRPPVPVEPSPQAGPSASSNQQTPGSQPAPRAVPRIVSGQGSGSTILVNSCQRGNPVLQHIRNIGWQYGDIVPDYQVGTASCVLFLSLRYHRLHPEYIHSRIQKLGRMYTLRILMVLCDVDQHQSAIKELTKVALVNDLTIVVAWSAEEVGGYLEKYKTFEHKPPDVIRTRVNDDYMSHLENALLKVRGVNKTDVVTLLSNFGSLYNIADASEEDLAKCPGFGDTKIRRLQDAFSQPFRVGETRTGRERRAEKERLLALTAGEDRSPHTPASALESSMHMQDRPALPEQQTAATRQQMSATEQQSALRSPVSVAATDISDLPDLPDDILEAGNSEWGDVLDGMTEEERLQLALEMSISGGDTS